jgi:hypothetical protein
MDDRSETSYKRLPGKGPRRSGLFSGLISRCTLYLGKDHILSVENQGFSEDYKRFYFSDIQAIMTRKTRRWPAWNIGLTCVIVLAGLLLPHTRSAGMFFWALCGVCVLFLLVNVARGPTCICHIMTAVQEDQLPSLNRVRVARKVIGTLKTAIENVQGTLSPEQIHASQTEVLPDSTSPARDLRRHRSNERQVRHYDGAAHMIAFGLMMADGILTGVLFLYHTVAISAASSVLSLIYCGCIIMALAKQYESDIPRAVRGVAWASLGFICISFVLSYIIMITSLMHKPKQQWGVVDQWAMYRAMFALSPKDSPFVMAVYIFAAACSLALGALGLILVKKHRTNSGRTAEARPNPSGEFHG